MQTEPDGRAVVASRGDLPLSGPQAPLLVLDVVSGYLDRVGIGEGPVSWELIGQGHSNVTFRLRRGAHDVVLRRGPRPPLPPSTHDMLREASLQQRLAAHAFPVPRVLAVCADETLLGVPFYLMEHVDGVVVTDRTPPALQAPGDPWRIGEAAVAVLARLHEVDTSTAGWSGVGRPDGYLARQVRRFGSLWAQVSQRDLPMVGRLAGWLADHLPETQRTTVVHGDFRLGNLMLHDRAPVGVAAVLDWEMATLGDPLADLGYLTATWADPRFEPTVMELSTVTRDPGWPDRDDLVALYAERCSLDVGRLPWYQALALWKAAVFSEAIHTRWRAGERSGDATFAPVLESGVPRLLDAAAEAAGIRSVARPPSHPEEGARP